MWLNPKLFAEEILGIETLWKAQVEILESIRDNKFTTVRSGHNIGKTHTAAIAAWWFGLSRYPATVLTTASTAAQVKDVLWKEMRRQYSEAAWPMGGDLAPKAPVFEFGDTFFRGFSPGNPGSVQGRHNKHVLVIFDEAQEIQDRATWEAFDSLMSTKGAKWLAIGNPLYAAGPFRASHKSKMWKSLKMSCLDHPNVRQRETIIEAAVGHEHIESYKADHMKCPGTEFWDTRVDGEFPKRSANTLLPEAWVEKCYGLPSSKLLKGRYLGFDPAEFGGDRSVVAVNNNNRIEKFYRWQQKEAGESVREVMLIATNEGIPFEHINYDSCGPVGSRITRAFQNMNCPAHPIFLGKEPSGDWDALYAGERDKDFLNRRAELYWTLRVLFELERISIDPRQAAAFLDEVADIQYGFFDDGRLYIEAKKKYRERNKMSPDHADAVMLSLARDHATPILTMGASDREHDPSKYSPYGR